MTDIEIEVGRFGNLASLRGALFNARVPIDEFTEAMIRKVRLEKERRKVCLTILSVKELGFMMGATYAEILKAAASRGLNKCPQESAFDVILQCITKLPPGKEVAFVTNTIADANGCRCVFTITPTAEGYATHIDSDLAYADSDWGISDLMAFCCVA